MIRWNEVFIRARERSDEEKSGQRKSEYVPVAEEHATAEAATAAAGDDGGGSSYHERVKKRQVKIEKEEGGDDGSAVESRSWTAEADRGEEGNDIAPHLLRWRLSSTDLVLTYSYVLPMRPYSSFSGQKFESGAYAVVTTG
ncbi:hypothetical protein ALC62_09004 [Cyphomyrmex costatus]|uniref:Uncharacterized protein n=1 Tax=Cyphomyrmex costatus TaxID=456900 RepID=A0A151IG10_9HYME|nr:hypothetical protein ALC62_09004 [Cyphomyrmex costatus]